MPEITIEQSTFERLQRHAEPLLDTTDKAKLLYMSSMP